MDIEENKLHIDYYLTAINNENIDELENLKKNNTDNKEDIIYKIYKKGLLTCRNLQFIIEHCINDLSISTLLIKELIKDNNITLLNIIFKEFKFYDNQFILNLLLHYKHKKAINISNLNQLVSNEIYKIPIDMGDEEINKNSSIYLIKSCKNGNESLVKYLVELGVDINGDSTFGSAIFNACENGNEVVVKYLVKHGADVNKRYKKKFFFLTPLTEACRKGHETLAKYLIEHGADVNKQSHSIYDGPTPLTEACRKGNESLAKYLIGHGADVNMLDCTSKPIEYCSSLHFACRNGHETLVKYLVEQGADVNSKDKFDGTPLMYACEIGNETIVNYLIEHGANINECEFTNYQNPLINACEIGNETIVKVLVEHRANINWQTRDGFTPIIIACKNSNIAIIKYLAEHGADINIETFDDDNSNEVRSPIVYSIISGNESVLQCLIELGVDINEEDSHGKTPLFHACSCKNAKVSIVKLLIEHGANIDKKNRDGNIYLNEALKNGYIDVFNYLNNLKMND